MNKVAVYEIEWKVNKNWSTIATLVHDILFLHTLAMDSDFNRMLYPNSSLSLSLSLFALLWTDAFCTEWVFGLWNAPKPTVFAKRLIIILAVYSLMVQQSHLLSNQENRFQTNCSAFLFFLVKSLYFQRKCEKLCLNKILLCFSTFFPYKNEIYNLLFI